MWGKVKAKHKGVWIKGEDHASLFKLTGYTWQTEHVGQKTSKQSETGITDPGTRAWQIMSGVKIQTDYFLCLLNSGWLCENGCVLGTGSK